MKKRKFKLFASISSLVLVVAVMAVGVWAATQQAVAITSNVSFESTGVNVSLVGNVTNATQTITEYTDSAVATDSTTEMTPWAIGALTFKSTNGGIDVAAGDKFIYIELEITNDNAADGFSLNVAMSGVTAPVAATNNAEATYAVGTVLADTRTAAAAELATTLITGPDATNITTITATNTMYLVIAIEIQNINVDVTAQDVNFTLTFTRAS